MNQADARLRIISYNIHGGVGTDGIHSYERIGRWLAERGADIALLQEFDTRSQQRDTVADIQALCSNRFQQLLPSPTVTTAHGWYGNAILTRYPVQEVHTIDTSQRGLEPRNIQQATLQTPSGTLQVINTHNGLQRIERKVQIGLLSDHIAGLDIHMGLPLVVAGDFNEWQLFSRAFSTLNQLLTPHATGKTFPTRCPVFRLDRAWSSPADIVQAARVVKTPETRRYSDHYPIELELTLAAASARSR